MSVAFVHQNEVVGMQGGVERYVSTLMSAGGSKSFLITERVAGQDVRRLPLRLSVCRVVPKWIRFAWAVGMHLGEVRRYIRDNNITVLEFSRAEYALFAFLLPARKVFTFHGTGPLNTERFQRLMTWSFSWLVLFQADVVQVIGPDARAMPAFVQRALVDKIKYTDAWFDDCFRSSQLPDAEDGVHIFYAGRIAPQKNPELLFAVMREARKRWGKKVVFDYFGSDGDLIPKDLRGDILIDRGLQSPEGLARSMASCHFGLLTSYYEGSPFIVIESLACGRGYVLPPIKGLLKTYDKQTGIVFSPDYTVDSFMCKIGEMIERLETGALEPQSVSAGVQNMSKDKVTANVYRDIYQIAL